MSKIDLSDEVLELKINGDWDKKKQGQVYKIVKNIYAEKYHDELKINFVGTYIIEYKADRFTVIKKDIKEIKDE